MCVLSCSLSEVVVMPFGGGNKCPKCGKTVYMAEEVLAAGNKYHKMCCKCDDCGKLLDRYTPCVILPSVIHSPFSVSASHPSPPCVITVPIVLCHYLTDFTSELHVNITLPPLQH